MVLIGGLDLQNTVDEVLTGHFDRHFMIKRLAWAVENLKSVSTSVCRLISIPNIPEWG